MLPVFHRNELFGLVLIAFALMGAASLTGCRSGTGADIAPNLDSSNAVGGLHRFEFKQPHMGTLFTIALYATDEVKARAAADAAFAKVAALERGMTDYDPESELMQLCQRPVGQPVRVSDELFYVLQKSQCLSELSNGAFDVTIGPVVRLWRRARRTETLPSPEMLARARASVGHRKLRLDPRAKTVTLAAPNMQLDLGGIAKGFAADKALEVLKRHGVPRALVAASGDIAIGDPPPDKRAWRVGIGAFDTNRAHIAGNLLIRNAGISTSGDLEQFVEIGGQLYSHIVDPRTGLGLAERLQVTIVGKSTTDTDSFATAVSILGVEKGMRLVESQPGMAAVILRKAGAKIEVFESRRFKRIPQARRSSRGLPVKEGGSGFPTSSFPLSPFPVSSLSMLLTCSAEKLARQAQNSILPRDEDCRSRNSGNCTREAQP